MIISPQFLNSYAKNNHITEYNQESILLENRSYFLNQDTQTKIENMIYFCLIAI